MLKFEIQKNGDMKIILAAGKLGKMPKEAETESQWLRILVEEEGAPYTVFNQDYPSMIESPILSEFYVSDSGCITQHGRAWCYPGYAAHNFMEVLRKNGHIIFNEYHY